MSEFEPIPEEIPRQSRSAQKDGGSSDRKSKSSDKHAAKEKKSRSSKNRTSKGDSPPSGQGGHGHGRLGSNGSSKSGSKHKSEPLISLTSTAEMDMGLPEPNNVHGTVPVFPFFLSIRLFCCHCSSFLLRVGSQNGECHNAQLLSAPAIILYLYSSIPLVPSSAVPLLSLTSVLFSVSLIAPCSPFLLDHFYDLWQKHRCYLSR